MARLSLVLVGLLLPLAAAQAAPRDMMYQGPDTCATCHPAESEGWYGSTHAMAYDNVLAAINMACSDPTGGDCTCLSCHTTGFDAQAGTFGHEGVTCEACHGPYDGDHPAGEAAVLLDSDSCICEDCHAETEHQWENSVHAAGNVQCISCHDVHSQELRQSEDSLCISCHRTQPADTLHTTHLPNQVVCTDCHFSSVQREETLAVRATTGDPTVVNHKLNPDTSTACISCHSSPLKADTDAADIQPVVSVNEAKWTELTLELDETRNANQQLRVLPFVTLGVGLGIGVVIGAIVVMVFGLVCQRRRQE